MTHAPTPAHMPAHAHARLHTHTDTRAYPYPYTEKNVWLNQPNFGWFNHRIWLLYGQPNFWLSEQNSWVNKFWLIIPLFWSIQPNTMVNLKRRFCSSK